MRERLVTLAGAIDAAGKVMSLADAIGRLSPNAGEEPRLQVILTDAGPLVAIIDQGESITGLRRGMFSGSSCLRLHSRHLRP